MNELALAQTELDFSPSSGSAPKQTVLTGEGVLLCACGCGKRFLARSNGGKKQIYFSAKCRQNQQQRNSRKLKPLRHRINASNSWKRLREDQARYARYLSVRRANKSKPEQKEKARLRAIVKSKEGWTFYQTLRNEVLIALGGACKTCGFSDFRALQIDHPNGNGKQDRKKFAGQAHKYLRHVLNNLGSYQCLCANCNWIKRHTNKEWNQYAKIPAQISKSGDDVVQN